MLERYATWVSHVEKLQFQITAFGSSTETSDLYLLAVIVKNVERRIVYGLYATAYFEKWFQGSKHRVAFIYRACVQTE